MPKHQLKTQTIYCGDNLKMLGEIPDESVDLVYLDPPFNSNRNYEVFWGDAGEKRAFADRFGDAKAYIDYMQPRIVELYRVLKKTGSFYYHCDWHASHYVKVMLDNIFGFNNFQNEIIWKRVTSSKTQSKTFTKAHDTIFFYTKTDDFFFKKPFGDYDEKYIESYYKFTEKDGRKYGRWDFTQSGEGPKRYFGKEIGWLEPPKGKHWIWSQEKIDEGLKKDMFYFSKNGMPRVKRYLDEKQGQPIDSMWSDIYNIQGSSTESLGYPTQKPLELLERIIEASSNKNDIVLDPFCGCGTTLVAAQKLGRKWIGIDISPTACRVMSKRLWDLYKLDEEKDFRVISIFKTEDDLLKLPPFEFQNWAVIALGGIPNKIKSGDYGIDGKLYPIDMEKKKKTGIDLFGETDIYYPIQVKQKEKAGRPDMDSFETAIRRDGRNRGYFVSFDFTSDAIKEIKRLDKEGEIEIIPITVKELLKKEQFAS